jgi:hypothetical protein
MSQLTVLPEQVLRAMKLPLDDTEMPVALLVQWLSSTRLPAPEASMPEAPELEEQVFPAMRDLPLDRIPWLELLFAVQPVTVLDDTSMPAPPLEYDAHA